MTYKSKPDWCVFAGIAIAAAALYLHLGYWLAGPVLLILLLCAYPQSFELTGAELVIHDALTRRRIPYHTIRAARVDGRVVRICYGGGSQIVVAPAAPGAFAEALLRRAPRDRYVEYAFAKTTGAFRIV